MINVERSHFDSPSEGELEVVLLCCSCDSELLGLNVVLSPSFFFLSFPPFFLTDARGVQQISGYPLTAGPSYWIDVIINKMKNEMTKRTPRPPGLSRCDVVGPWANQVCDLIRLYYVPPAHNQLCYAQRVTAVST